MCESILKENWEEIGRVLLLNAKSPYVKLSMLKTIPHGALLGLEEIEECRAESEIDCQAAAQEDPNIIEMKKYDE